MSIELSDDDVLELERLVGDFRHKDALMLLQFLQRRMMRNRRPEVKVSTENGLAKAEMEVAESPPAKKGEPLVSKPSPPKLVQ